MALTLYMHPLASYCQKVIMALYENATPFEARIVDLASEAERAALVELWPVGKFPVLRDEARDQTVPESTIIIEYLALHYPGPVALVPADADLAIEVRLRDRFYDHYVHEPMQKIVLDKLRPAGRQDGFGVEQARAALRTAYQIIDREMASRTWAMGEGVTMADCAAAPSLFYANLVEPIGAAHPYTAAYHARLLARPSYARVLAEAQPYFASFPG